ncbi:excisionase family DNA binding protein [Microbacterium sp. AG790]|uniref:helix-turn-helix transcriptional regulator n=1 Tax=Microbacterium sp. AG790 TaxID=2183995 RepID=UPI000EB533A6|nr:DNA-binding protein [Microbacterium sp. AG790]RKS89573.1 excisionase family DNA binding protein [Microbacterium sp. AG790]
MSQHDTPWVPLETAAAHFCLSPDTIRRMITRGELEARRFGPRLIRVRIDDVVAAARPLHYAAGGDE